jgi:predicted phage terminase large subunit-like protein
MQKVVKKVNKFQTASGIILPASQNSTTGTQEEATYLSMLSNFNVGDLDLKEIPRSELQKLQRLLTPKLTKYIPHTPTPKQAAFLLLDCKEAFYGGAAGGGKSDALLMGGLQYVDIKGYAGIIFRKSYADLTKPEALMDRARKWLAPWQDQGEVKWNDKDRRWEFLDRYGPHKDIRSMLQFGYMENDNDRHNYQGGEYQFIGFDELTHISLICYQYMFSRLRKLKHVKIPLRVRGASNPPDDDSDGQWVYERFVKPETKRKGTVFIPAGMDDNPYLDKDSYEESLEELDPVTRARLRDGVWTIIRKGNMFKRNWFEFVDAPPRYRRRIRFWDMAATDEKQKQLQKKKRTNDPDYTVGLLMSEADGIYYIEDIIRDRKNPEGTEEMQKNCAASDGIATIIREEQEPGSSGLTAIDMKKRSFFVGYNYDGVRSTGSKVQRAMPFSSAAEKGKVKIVRGCRNIEAFFEEAEKFPGVGHDDTVDAGSGAFSELGLLPKEVLPMIFENEEGSYWLDCDSNDDYEYGLGYFGRI